MRQRIQPRRSRVAIAIVGATLVGTVAAVFGAGSVWHPATPVGGAVVQGNATVPLTSTASQTATAAAQTTVPPVPTGPPQGTSTPEPATTPTVVSNTIRGTVVSVDPGNHRLIISRNGVQTTIIVDDVTTYAGIATRLSDLQPGWRVSITIASREDSGVLAKSVFASPPDN